jgi:GNAT superfamily N-acetyltransferase
MDGIALREAASDDLAGIYRVRTSVTENPICPERLERMGDTGATITGSLRRDAKGWVAVRRGEIIGFSIAHQTSGSIFALFVLPGYERRGLGRRLLDAASAWLWDNGADTVWLTTAPDTRAARFYERDGWICSGVEANDELRFERKRPALRPARQEPRGRPAILNRGASGRCAPAMLH